MRTALGALFNFLASRPALARLVMVEVYAAGPAAIERREETLRPLEMILAEGRRRSPETPSIAFEAIASGIYSLAYKKIRESGPASLPSLAPVCTYIALAPFIGAEEACAVANGDGRARGGRAGRPAATPEALREVALVPIRQATLQAISSGVTSVQAIARDLGEPVETIQEQAEELERTGLAEFVERRKVGDADRGLLPLEPGADLHRSVGAAEHHRARADLRPDRAPDQSRGRSLDRKRILRRAASSAR